MFEDNLSFLKFSFEPDYEPQCVELSDEYINDINTEIVNTQDILNQLECNDEDDDYSEYLEILDEDTNSNEIQSQEVLSASNSDETLQKLAIDAYAKQIQSKFRKIRPKKIKLEEDDMSNITPMFVNTPSNVSIQDQASRQHGEERVKKSSQKSSFDYEADIDNFFNNMARIVKKLPPKTQADIKMDVLKIVSEAEADFSKKSNSDSMFRFSNIPGMIPKLVLVPCKIIDNQMNKT